MNRFKLILVSILLIFCLPYLLEAQEFAKVGTAGTQFLKLGVGARAVGLGGAFVAMANDASAVYWNPSGLVKVQNYSLLASHVEWLADIRFEALSFVKTIPNVGTFALSASLLTSGDMDITTYQFQEGTGETFSKTDLAVGISYARYLTDKFSFGGTIKYVRENYGTKNSITGDDEIASVFAFDIGSQYQTGFRSLRMGISIQNFGPEMQIPGKYGDITGFDSKTQTYVREPDEDYRPYHMPLMFRVGVAMELMETELNRITAVGDLVHPNDNVEQIIIGGEYSFRNMIALRAGFIGNHDAAKFAVGGGLKLAMTGLGEVNLDYGYTDFGVLEMGHQMSLMVNF